MDTEELGQNEQDAPLAWFGAQPPPRTGPVRNDPTLPRSFLRTPSSVSTAENDDLGHDKAEDDHRDGVGGGRQPRGEGGGEGDCADYQEDEQGVLFARDSRGDGGSEAGGAGIAAAGVGAAHVLTGPGRLEDGAWEEASSACPGMR